MLNISSWSPHLPLSPCVSIPSISPPALHSLLIPPPVSDLRPSWFTPSLKEGAGLSVIILNTLIVPVLSTAFLGTDPSQSSQPQQPGCSLQPHCTQELRGTSTETLSRQRRSLVGPRVAQARWERLSQADPEEKRHLQGGIWSSVTSSDSSMG